MGLVQGGSLAVSVGVILARIAARLGPTLFQAAFAFVATPYLTRALGPADFGLLGLAFCGAAFAQGLASFCSDMGAAEAKAKLPDDELVRYRNGVLTYTAINFLLLLVIAGAIALVFPAYVYALVLAPILGAVRFLWALEVSEGGQERMHVRESVLDASSGALALLLTVVMISELGWPWPARIAAMIIADLVLSGIRYGVLSDKLSRYRPVYDLGDLGRLFARGWPLMVALVAVLGMNHADRLIALAALTLVQVGYFVAAFRVASLLTTINRSLALALAPLISDRIAAGAPLRVIVMIHLCFGGAILLLGIGLAALFLEQTSFILGATFAPAAPIIATVCGAYSLQGIQRVAGIIRTHYGLVAPSPAHGYVALAAHAAVSYALIPSLGAYGIAIGVTVGYGITTLLSVVTAYRRLLFDRR
ncbi:MAG: lipopolysaccharide biosynthesis protein [Alphaproteobacteria bacterium]|nr:lipopolysaccharide biosynthesis protein [Alphaproteobacteria bacterium]